MKMHGTASKVILNCSVPEAVAPCFIFFSVLLPAPLQDYVAKIVKHFDENSDHYFQDCEMQALAGYIAELFVAMQIPKKCAYLEATGTFSPFRFLPRDDLESVLLSHFRAKSSG